LPPERPTLAELESAIADGLPRIDALALALLEIHERKLFRPAYRSFRDYLLRRWGMSRARGYQLLHFARIQRMSTTVGTDLPGNEREARRQDAQGKPRRPRETDRVLCAMNYVSNAFFRLPATRRLELIETLGELLAEMKRKLDREEGSRPPG
jgi:hypothetical protein